MSTLDEVRKGYESLSDEDKKTFQQSIAEPENGGGGEDEGGTKEEQPVKDGEQEPSAEEGDTEKDEGSETNPPAEEQKDKSLEEIGERLSRIEAEIEQLKQPGKKTPAPADDATAERLKRAESIYS